MNVPKPLLNNRQAIFLAAFFLFAGLCAAQNQSVAPHPPHWINGLRVSISLDQFSTPSHPSFRVELQNAGKDDLLLNVGKMAPAGPKEYATAISLTIFNSDGTPLRLEHIQATDENEANEKPLLLPLPSGATFSIPVHLENYRVTGSAGSPYEMKPGTYSIQARFNGFNAATEIDSLPRARILDGRFDEPFDRVVTEPVGSLTSNKLQFEISARS
jgi:hypothetical protein